jgi:ABC-type uncharacterized transport system involved in gliding motility auxiliary subunit
MPEPWPEPSPDRHPPPAAALSASTGPAPNGAPTDYDQDGDRRHARERVEMLAHFRRGITATTVMLKDLTPFGTRVEGVGALELDEFVSLALPGCRPLLAFVAWANEHCAGLQFVEPLAAAMFDDLVRQYGLKTIDPDKLRPIS